jgi:hypothetical protein
MEVIGFFEVVDVDQWSWFLSLGNGIKICDDIPERESLLYPSSDQHSLPHKTNLLYLI